MAKSNKCPAVISAHYDEEADTLTFAFTEVPQPAVAEEAADEAYFPLPPMSPAPELQFYYEPYALGQPQVPPITTDDSQGLRRCPQRRRHCLAGDVRAVRTFCEWDHCFTDEG